MSNGGTMEGGAYLRVSTSQQSKEGTSLQSQEEHIRKYMEKANLILNPKMIWRDVVSGTTPNN